MVTTALSGVPISITLFSLSVAVGQACTQAPHDTHSESKNGCCCAGDTTRVEAAARDGQGEGALHLLAGAHAARANDALGWLVGEIRIRRVAAGLGMVLAAIAVAHLAQADGPGHVLQFAVAVGRASQAVERVIGDVELHHALAQPLQPVGLRLHHHASATGVVHDAGVPLAALDLDQAQPAGAERFQHVGGAELGDLRCRLASPRA